MPGEVLERRSRLPCSVEEAFRWHARPGAFQRLLPPWEPVKFIDERGGIRDGDSKTVEVKVGLAPVRWVAEHGKYIENEQFYDIQAKGPFARWEHTHRFEPDGRDACYLIDHVEYELPLGAAGRALAASSVRRKLERLFASRHERTIADLAAHRRYSATPVRVLISGATGLVGSALVPLLTSGGHDVAALARGAGLRVPKVPLVSWDPADGRIDAAAVEGFDAVVHLAGENIAAGRWTESRKAKIRDSRVQGTRLLCETIARAARRPRVLVSASAVGYYGDRGDEVLDESSSAGSGFLAEVCQAWEAATRPAAEAGIRVVHARFGVILTPAGGALAKMLLPFKMGAGGVLGSGRQYMSWISIDDVAVAILHAMATESLAGPVNVVAPEAVTNREFTRELGRALHRPTIIPMPAAAARLAFGQMADEALLASQGVTPSKLIESGFQFRHPTLREALAHVLGSNQ